MIRRSYWIRLRLYMTDCTGSIYILVFSPIWNFLQLCNLRIHNIRIKIENNQEYFRSAIKLVFPLENSFFLVYRLPEKYSSLKLPNKLPPKREPIAVSVLPMLGYMEQLLEVPMRKALTAVGCLKPKFPFLSAKQSALLYVAYHLKGKSSLIY